ncbi:MAG: hypothetical protein V1746_02755 [bacterium]
MTHDSNLPEGFSIRPFQLKDKPALYDICIQTADSGNDASHLYSNKEALPDFYVGPYLEFAPEFAFVVVDAEQKVCGYVIGCPDSKAFYERVEKEWLPTMREKYSQLHQQIQNGSSEETPRTQGIIKRFSNPNFHFPHDFEEFPSHIHMNFFPHAQRKGLGIELFHCITSVFQKAGSTGIHLGTGTKNQYANPFYAEDGLIGATVLEQDAITTYYGFPLPHAPMR